MASKAGAVIAPLDAPAEHESLPLLRVKASEVRLCAGGGEDESPQRAPRGDTSLGRGGGAEGHR